MNSQYIIGGRVGDGVHRAEVLGDLLCRDLPDVGDAEREQELRQRLRLRRLNRLDELRRLEVVEIRGVVDQLIIYELGDTRVGAPATVQRAERGEVDEALARR